MSIHFALLALTFGNPAILWGLVLMLVPLLLHLLFRRTQQIEPWGAMRFLQAAIRRRRQRLRLESLLQLAIRSLLLGFIILAAADPKTSATTDKTGTVQQIHRLLVLDTSLSSRATDGTQSAFSRMIKAARQIQSEAKPGDSFQVIQSAQNIKREIISQPSFDPEAILNELNLLEPSYDRGDLVKTLREAQTQLELAPVDSPKELIILSDFQTREWFNVHDQPHSGLRDVVHQLSSIAAVSLIDTGVEPLPNSSLTKLHPVRSWLYTNHPSVFSFEIHHDAASEVVAADILVDGAPHSRQLDKLDRGTGIGNAAVTFLSPGEHAVEVVIPDDGLAADNRLQTVVHVRRSLSVLLSEEPGADIANTIDYLQTALTLGEPGHNLDTNSENTPRFAVEKYPEGNLRTRDLSQVDCLILRNPSALQLEEVQQLANYVRAGGGLIIIPSPLTSLSSFNSLFSRETQLAPMDFEEKESREVTLEIPQFFETDLLDHAILAPFDGYPDSGFKTTRVYKYFPVESLSATARVIVRLPGGEPIVVEQDYGSGRVIELAVPLEPEWTSWVVWPSFIPMLHQAVQHCSEGRVRTPVLTVGETFEWEFPDSAAVADYRLTRPDGNSIAPILKQGERALLSFSDVSLPGTYHLINAGENLLVPIDVRVPLEETILTYAPPGKLVNTVLADLPVRSGTDPTTILAREFRSGSRSESSPSRLTELFLALAALLMLTDIVAGRSLSVAGLCLLIGLTGIFLVMFLGISPRQVTVALGSLLLLILIAGRSVNNPFQAFRPLSSASQKPGSGYR